MFYRSIAKIILCSLVLTGCATTTNPGPIVIRDSVIQDSAAQDSEQRSPAIPAQIPTSPVTTESKAAIAQPVLPRNAVPSTSSPFKNKLIQQSRERLQKKDAKGAIALAEKGLRVDRKEAYFYQLLASAYQLLGNKTQSIYFAKQGLRYAPRQSEVYQSLLALSK